MPISYEEELSDRRLAILELKARGYKQNEIAKQLGISEAAVSKSLSIIRAKAREDLTNHYQELPLRYKLVIENLERIRREAWQTVAHTTDSRSKSVLFNTLIAVNREILDVIAAGDLIEQEVANAELIAKEAREDMQKAKEKIAEEAGKTPRTEGFSLDVSVSTSKESREVAVVDSEGGAVAIAVVGDNSVEEEEEGREGEDSSSNSNDSSARTYDIVGDSGSGDSDSSSEAVVGGANSANSAVRDFESFITNEHRMKSKNENELDEVDYTAIDDNTNAAANNDRRTEVGDPDSTP